MSKKTWYLRPEDTRTLVHTFASAARQMKRMKKMQSIKYRFKYFLYAKKNEPKKTCLYWLLKVINQILGNQWKCVYDCGFQDPLIVIILGRSHRFSFSSHSMHNIISMNCNFISWSKIWCSNYAEHTTLGQHNAQAWVHFVMVVLYAKFHAVWLCCFT